MDEVLFAIIEAERELDELFAAIPEAELGPVGVDGDRVFYKDGSWTIVGTWRG